MGEAERFRQDEAGRDAHTVTVLHGALGGIHPGQGGEGGLGNNMVVSKLFLRGASTTCSGRRVSFSALPTALPSEFVCGTKMETACSISPLVCSENLRHYSTLLVVVPLSLFRPHSKGT